MIFVALVSLCSSIFVLGRDLKFPWIDQTLGDDFLGIAHLLPSDYLDSFSWQLDLAWVVNREVLCPPVVLFLQRDFSVLRCSSRGDVFQLQRYQIRCESTELACLSSACSDRLIHCCLSLPSVNSFSSCCGVQLPYAEHQRKRWPLMGTASLEQIGVHCLCVEQITGGGLPFHACSISCLISCK